MFACMRKQSHAYAPPIANLIFDLSDESKLFEIIDRVEPDGIVHLAAQSKVKEAWDDPVGTLQTNTYLTIALIEAVKRFAPRCKVITAGSSEEYGWTGKLGSPLTEEDACLPQNPYAASKLAAGQLALQIAGRNELNVIHVRPFNHFGPGQREGFVVSDFASQVARIENGMSPPVMKIGNLEAERDFTDVRDVVAAYISLIEAEVDSGVYNICTGNPVKIERILRSLLSLSKVPIDIQTDSTKMRISEVPLFVGSSEKLFQATGWKPSRQFEESISETLDWWRKQYVLTK